MNILNFVTSLFTSGRRPPQMFNLFRNKRNNRGWIWFSLLGLGTIFSVAATRNSNIKKPIQRLFQSVQNTAKTFTPAKLNFANTEFAHEITPNKQKKQK
ncbi:hypothetical protein ACRS6Y_12565 [Bacillus cytotoxicus]|nr:MULTISPECIES: hypothetical protein [Bacillus cereus group]AWC44694.1 hypothetical protein CG479_009285 [Bacillus cytotoxicus]MDH2864206.1 hypothetical protein [Bacillus cytotoxicus]MDH2880115.1 hypothetical protein [Bacillus cytotoxicus]MDH2885174.1 hypothetical protein [Bacillus cytotoxicus]MDH2889537.1 hypothetical protein [Bacillus cytotoxicus]